MARRTASPSTSRRPPAQAKKFMAEKESAPPPKGATPRGSGTARAAAPPKVTAPAPEAAAAAEASSGSDSDNDSDSDDDDADDGDVGTPGALAAPDDIVADVAIADDAIADDVAAIRRHGANAPSPKAKREEGARNSGGYAAIGGNSRYGAGGDARARESAMWPSRMERAASPMGSLGSSPSTSTEYTPVMDPALPNWPARSSSFRTRSMAGITCSWLFLRSWWNRGSEGLWTSMTMSEVSG